MKVKKIVCDTSIIIDGKITEMLKKNEFEGLEEIIIPNASLDELQSQASHGRNEGYVGLEELKKIRELCKEKKIKIRFTGERPTLEEIKSAYGKALAFAVHIGCVNDQTIKLMISKAVSQERRLDRIMSGEPEEIIAPAPVEEKKEEPKEEKKESSAAGLASLFG